jgi:pyruvate dehydrogenase E2 component (dihydrolipoamide acetyltransferase)
MIQGEDEDASPAPKSESPKPEPVVLSQVQTPAKAMQADKPLETSQDERIIASPLAKRIAVNKGLDLTTLKGSGPNGRIVKADVEAFAGGVSGTSAVHNSPPLPLPAPHAAIDTDIPHEVIKLSNMRKIIARRLTESKQQVPHIYLTVDVRLDALLKLRGEINASLEARGIKLSVNDMLIKALALALVQVPKCNVSFAGDNMLQYARADISVAVSVPTGLITPIITDAANKSLSKISTEVGELAARAKEGKLQPHEYQGGTASISNMGMMGIKQFDAVINPPQGMILAVGAGEKRPYIVDDALAIATVMSATGSFDHRAIDGADGAMFMKVFKELVEKPLGLVA